VVIADFLPKFGSNLAAVAESTEPTSVEPTLKSEIQNLIQHRIQTGEANVYDTVIGHVERQLIAQVLQVTQGNQVEAANILGITRTTLRTKIKKLGIQINRSIATRADGSDFADQETAPHGSPAP
jgi:two-component system nitrogen regulation response regulator GlnG